MSGSQRDQPDKVDPINQVDQTHQLDQLDQARQINQIDQIHHEEIQQLEEKFDPEMRFRPVVPPAATIVKWLLVTLSCFHYYPPASGSCARPRIAGSISRSSLD